MITTPDGREWATANEVPELWPDVTPARVRDWARNGKVNGYRIGSRVYYDINDLTEIEYQTRTSSRGHKRGVVFPQVNHVTC